MKWFYRNREERSKWLAERFEKQITHSETLLDVGCYNADFKAYIPKKIKYIGVDIAGKPDLFINLDNIEKLPFEEDEFDAVVCADVLEHLENIHLIFDELCRVSSKYVIITLPNTFASIPEVLKGKKYNGSQENSEKFGKTLKFYGLPFEKPLDRHRWFFSFDEAIEFVKYRAEKMSFKIVIAESEYFYEKKSFMKKTFFAILRMINKNLVDRNIIILLKKQ